MATEDDFVKEFRSTPGRFEVIEHLVTTAGAQNILQMSPPALRAWWNTVQAAPDVYRVNGGIFVGLKMRGPEGGDLEAFHAPTYEGAHEYELTDSGIEMLRWTAQRQTA